MCYNENCMFPFQDEAAFKNSLKSITKGDKKKRPQPPSDEAKPATVKRIRAPETLTTAPTVSCPLESARESSTASTTISTMATAGKALVSLESVIAPILLPPTSTFATPGLHNGINIGTPLSSPKESIPDLIFDVFSSESWITPVTPPDTILDPNTAMKTIHPTVDTTSAQSLESLLFSDDFDIDFSGIDGSLDGNMATFEFDPELEAILEQQQL
ncbi:hypothetical protein BGW38_007363 [Lunasporangiospora selenospora]|uniref:Uncharacterized protein n=1 Tax=Lunasporangiospora selenospora TaxID=979761 RepID=A0A9P6FLF4_9FUNG|nr:hypothetical protein BGW38_007363 [Lunasporangiospora selenospora]